MITELTLLVLGIFLLVKGATLIVGSASSMARKFGISELVIGLTIVALGTTLPELLVNLVASLRGNAEIAIGNIIGSNLTNTLLILGVAAIITAVSVQKQIVFKQIPFNMLSILVLGVLAHDIYFDGVGPNQLTRSDGLIFLLFLLVYIYYLVETVSNGHHKEEKDTAATSKIISKFVLGTVGLFIGARFTVDGAVYAASFFGVSEFLISATIIAVGTSLPELVTAIISARAGKTDLIVGDLVGANVLNIFFILGLSSLINPVPIPSFISFDILFLLFATFGLFSLLLRAAKSELSSGHGIALVLCYLTYVGLLIVRG